MNMYLLEPLKSKLLIKPQIIIIVSFGGNDMENRHPT